MKALAVILGSKEDGLGSLECETSSPNIVGLGWEEKKFVQNFG
jgi:hypothetical protein